MAARKQKAAPVAARLPGRYVNTGAGPTLQPIDIGHKTYTALVSPDTAFWTLVKKNRLADSIADKTFIQAYKKKEKRFVQEIEALRFGLKPTAVYFNCTERCNLNCTYCYIPERMRKRGKHMSEKQMVAAMKKLKRYFRKNMDKGDLPQIIFHGAEPMLNRDALFNVIDAFGKDFRFGVQTNGTLLDESAVQFLTKRGVGIGLSLDGAVRRVADRTRKTWDGEGVSDKVLAAIDQLRGYPGFNVIATVTTENMKHLNAVVDFFHSLEVPACMLNMVRCTLPGARTVKPKEQTVAKYFMKALDRTYELYRKTGRKIVVANFANILVSIVAPTARRLMCDISPCGGGRCFFALAPSGDMFPCSEFIGLKRFCGGNLFRDSIEQTLKSEPFRLVTERKVEDIDPCQRCAIRHFCGSPCPAEAHEMNGGMDQIGAFCEFYEEQVRYALRLIADQKEDAFLWDGWDKGTSTLFDASLL